MVAVCNTIFVASFETKQCAKKRKKNTFYNVLNRIANRIVHVKYQKKRREAKERRRERGKKLKLCYFRFICIYLLVNFILSLFFFGIVLFVQYVWGFVFYFCLCAKREIHSKSATRKYGEYWIACVVNRTVCVVCVRCI